MRIDIRGSDFPITTALVDHTERRLRFALTRSCDRVVRIAVIVGDSNGRRGGEDKFCRIQIHLQPATQVLIEEIGADLVAVIDRAAERAGRNVAKRVDRLEEKSREAKRKPPGPPPVDVSGVPND